MEPSTGTVAVMGVSLTTNRSTVRMSVRGLGIAAAVAALVMTGACTSGTPGGRDTGTPTTAPATSSPSSPGPTSAPTDSSTPTPTPTPTGVSFVPTDPDTWTISGDEVGPIALGGTTSAEVDDLHAAFTEDTGGCPASPETSFWHRDGSPGLIVESRDGQVSGVEVGGPGSPATTVTGPETTAGTGVGSSLAELRAAHPDLQALPTGSSGEQAAVPTLWTIDAGSRHITFRLGRDGEHVALVWVGQQAEPPYEFCG